ncbi:hypothetical protein K2Q00_02395 [Patescibacteria group bacterium]|nr:hypothetical protein [Patescibacteria group bacterium]
MKRIYQRYKYQRHSEYVARKALRKRKRRAVVIKALRHKFRHKTRREIRRIKDFAHYKEHISAPVNCCFLENTTEVINFFNKLEECRMKKRRVFVVLRGVAKLDYGAVSILLSIMTMFKLERIGFNGDFPKDAEARKLIAESGFFDYINDGKMKDDIEYIAGRKNQIFTHANKKVEPSLSQPIMEAASITVWNEKRIDSGLHSVMMELMQNTNNHASTDVPGEKHWWLSVNHDLENKKVSFAFLDHGVGILTSLHRKPPESIWGDWVEKVKKGIGISTNDEFLKALLDGKIHQTVTGKTYRGKGLPNIKRMLDFKRISNLHIITNNVAGNGVTGEYKLLDVNFQGTFFYWELCESNFNRPWTIKT